MATRCPTLAHDASSDPGIHLAALEQAITDAGVVSTRRADLHGVQHPFRVAIVCAMWLTGFDVECLSTLYIDKPMKAHTLIQAIARANRVYPTRSAVSLSTTTAC
jgi:type I restriction enzyme R subunit